MRLRLSLLGITFVLPTTNYAAEQMLWPDEGHFLAYPAEPDQRGVVPYVSAGIIHDNNAFRLADGEDPNLLVGTAGKSDTIKTLGLGINTIIEDSRQKYLFNASADYYDYNRFTFLDHWNYKLGAGWRWEAGNLWNGDLRYSRRRDLADPAELQGRTKDLITQDTIHASGNYKFHPSWKARTALDINRYEHGDSARESLDNRTIAATIGADYTTASNNTLGIQFKATDGRYPNRQIVATSFVDNQYKEYETSGVVGWQFTEKTKFDGRLGYTQRRHEELSSRDFNGVTGRAALQYLASAKTSIDFAAYRETRVVEDANASYAFATGYILGPSWAPTHKSVLQARLVYEKRKYEGDPGLALGVTTQREDTLRGLRLSAGYKPIRNTEVIFAFERGKRTSNLADAGYDYNMVSINAGWKF